MALHLLGQLGCLYAAWASHALAADTALVPLQLQDSLRIKLTTPWGFVDPNTATAEDRAQAQVLIPGGSLIHDADAFEKVLTKLPNGQLLQWPFTGVDMLNLTAIPKKFAICDVHQGGVAIPEYVMGAILTWNVRLPQTDAAFRQCTWHDRRNSCSGLAMHREARGQTLGIIGYGTIGQAVVQRAVAFGMRAVAVTYPLPKEKPAELAWIGGDSQLPRLMKESDFVVVAVPLNHATRGLVSAKVIQSMKPTGVLINIARGPIVDEAGLYEALRSKRIEGAILDVWWNDFAFFSNTSSTWPSKYNFSQLQNVWMTPHMSSNTAEAHDEALGQMAANLDALARGEPLQNVVRKGENSARSTMKLVV